MKNIKKLKFTWHSRFTNYKWVKITNESLLSYSLGVSKKTGKPIKPEKNNRKNRTEKKPIKPITFLKKPAGSVRFRFYKQKTEKTKPNRTETGWFDPVSVRFRFFFSKKKISVWLLFLIKTEPDQKWSPLIFMTMTSMVQSMHEVRGVWR